MVGWLMMEDAIPAIPLRTDFDAAEARALARKVTDPNQVRRLLAIAAIYDGMNRAEAAAVGGMDRQSLRDWVHRFNTAGPEGLHDRKASGAVPKLTASQKAELAALVEAGPDPQSDGVARWRRIDLKKVIRDYFGVDYHERSVSRLLHDLGFSHMNARPRHPDQDAAMPEWNQQGRITMPGRSKIKDGPHPVDVHVGKRLRMRRTLLGMSQEQVAEALGLTFQQLQKYEKGSNRVSASRLFELSKILDVPESFFFEEMPTKPKGRNQETVPTTDTVSDPMNKRETLEFVRAYYRIKEPAIRESIAALTRAMAN